LQRSLGGEFQPTLGPARVPRAAAQEPGWSVADSPLPQALFLICQQLNYELRLRQLDILLWTAPESAPTMSAVVQPTIRIGVKRARTRRPPVFMTSGHILAWRPLYAKTTAR
jgi:hypothetical protein